MNLKIAGVGEYLPERLLTNEDLAKVVDTTDEWITSRVGIKYRHVAREDEYTSDMAIEAARDAIKDSGIDPKEIELILCATISAEMHTPSASCIVQRELGLDGVPAMDLNTACSGFVSALIVADQFIKAGTYKTILVIAADTMTKLTDWTDRASCVLFGDGAGAVVVTAAGDNPGIMAIDMGADGEGGKNITLPSLKYTEEDNNRRLGPNKRTFWQDGGAVYKFAVRMMSASVLRTVERAGLTMDDIAMVVPHQANGRIIEASAKRLGIGMDRMYENVQRTGNMSAACIPVAFCEAVREGRIRRGDRVVLVGMGGGLTWASVVFQF